MKWQLEDRMKRQLEDQMRQQLVDQGGQGSGWQTGLSHICMQINQEEQLGSKTDHTIQGSSERRFYYPKTSD